VDFFAHALPLWQSISTSATIATTAHERRA
jgi:hypothetical protein